MTQKMWVICICGCGSKYLVRTEDVNRGWDRYLNASHKIGHKRGGYKV